jgi:hypothetical protein
MSDETPYVRPSLTVTRLGVPDAALLVDLWLDRFIEESEGGDRIGPERAYELLAHFGRLMRCRPDLLEAAGRCDVSSHERSRLRSRMGELARLALVVPEPAGWLRAATELANACDDGEDESRTADLAADLLEDLDDADLVAWAARSTGIADTVLASLEEGLTRCRLWLADNPDRFFTAGVLIQGIGQTLRHDLVAVDADLAATADKFILLLDAIEDAEAALTPRLAVTRTVPGRSAEAWSWMPGPMLALAADNVAHPGLARRRWCSPDGRSQALLVIDRGDSSARSVRVRFRGDQGLAELAGQTAWLAGVASTIDPQGNADFALSALVAARQSGAAHELAVGDRRSVWSPTEED